MSAALGRNSAASPDGNDKDNRNPKAFTPVDNFDKADWDAKTKTEDEDDEYSVKTQNSDPSFLQRCNVMNALQYL